MDPSPKHVTLPITSPREESREVAAIIYVAAARPDTLMCKLSRYYICDIYISNTYDQTNLKIKSVVWTVSFGKYICKYVNNFMPDLYAHLLEYIFSVCFFPFSFRNYMRGGACYLINEKNDRNYLHIN